MKILFVLENYYPHIGGVETLFKNLADALSSQGHQVSILTTLKNPQDKVEEKFDNITVYRKNYLNRYFFTFFAFFAAFRLAKDCDLIHTTSYNAALPAWLAGTFRSKKVIITFHEVWGDLWFKLPYMSKIGARLHYSFERMLLRLNFYKFVGVSNFTRDALIQQGVQKERVEKIYNGIDYQEFADDNHKTIPNTFTFTFFGRLGISKGIELYLRAISMMSDEHQQVNYQLIVPTQPKPFLEGLNDLIDDLGIRDKLSISHNLPFSVLKEKIANSAAIVIPSYSEGFCFAAIETMAIGTPIISSGKGALSEVVTGKHLIMNTFDAEGLKQSMDLALQGKWKEIAKKKFELTDTVDNYLSLYADALED